DRDCAWIEHGRLLLRAVAALLDVGAVLTLHRLAAPIKTAVSAGTDPAYLELRGKRGGGASPARCSAGIERALPQPRELIDHVLIGPERAVAVLEQHAFCH